MQGNPEYGRATQAEQPKASQWMEGGDREMSVTQIDIMCWPGAAACPSCSPAQSSVLAAPQRQEISRDQSDRRPPGQICRSLYIVTLVQRTATYSSPQMDTHSQHTAFLAAMQSGSQAVRQPGSQAARQPGSHTGGQPCCLDPDLIPVLAVL